MQATATMVQIKARDGKARFACDMTEQAIAFCLSVSRDRCLYAHFAIDRECNITIEVNDREGSPNRYDWVYIPPKAKYQEMQEMIVECLDWIEANC